MFFPLLSIKKVFAITCEVEKNPVKKCSNKKYIAMNQIYIILAG